MHPYTPYILCLVRVVAGLLFMQHGAEKLFGFAGARPETTLWSIRGVGGILEIVGGPLLALGLFTRPTAFILSGEMAVAYFRSWAPRGFFPIANGGEEATLNSFIFLWLVAAGAGALSLDALIERRRGIGDLARRLASWEPQVRSILRVIVGFLITLHGIRKIFEVMPTVAGRRGAPPFAIDALPPVTGYLEIVAGPLIMLGLLTRPTSIVMSVYALLAYVFVAQPRTLWPIRNGGIEALLYFTVFLYFFAAGAGAWSLDARTASEKRRTLMRTAQRIAMLLIVLLPVSAAAHHGSAISYDTTNLWTTWATVKEFSYQNPHPTMTFERTTKDGKVESWVSELLTNPAVLARAGWTRSRSNEALKPGTRVKLYLGTSRAGGHSAIVMKLENEKGENIVGDRAGVKAVADLDGVPDGLQPKGERRLPGQPTSGQ